MFETAEIGARLSDEEYARRAPELRRDLLEAQFALRKSGRAAIILLGGVDKGGKGEIANLLSAWMDTRHMVTRAYSKPSDEERERPEYWRFWRGLPPSGHIGIFLRAWYSKPILQRVYGRIDDDGFDRQLDRIVAFERTLAADRYEIMKFWMHLGREAQAERFRALESDPATAWRVKPSDWKHWERYDDFVAASEHVIMRTSTGRAPWTLVEGWDPNYRSIAVASHVLEGLRRAVSDVAPGSSTSNGDEAGGLEATGRPVVLTPGVELGAEDGRDDDGDASGDASPSSLPTVLSTLDLSLRLSGSVYRERLAELQGQLNGLQRRAREQGVTTLVVFQGWDAAGKGGAIRRITSALDARDYRVMRVGPPTDEEAARHYLWRFWRRLPRAGRVTIYDRSWYGRVLVERVEGFAREEEWRRAYAEINRFESSLVEHGMVLAKFWLHISAEEQARRFEARARVPHKRWKLTDEDVRNRDKRAEYARAVHEMVERTSTRQAPWRLVEAEDKRFARIAVLETLCARMAGVVGEAEDGSVPDA